MEFRVCLNPNCEDKGIEKPLTEEYFVLRKSNEKFRGFCRKCQEIYNKKYHLNNQEKINKNSRKYRKSNIGKK